MAAVLIQTPDGLGLGDDEDPRAKPVVIDLLSARRLSRSDQLFRALGIGKGVGSVVDATAGLGRDAASMALSGLQVTACERAPLLVALWRDALARAGTGLLGLRFHEGDARAYLESVADAARPDVVYLDPMYPHGKRSAAPQKEMVLVRQAVGDDADVELLLAAARAAAKLRVVVKRPKKAPSLGTPSHSFDGQSTRYDLYLR